MLLKSTRKDGGLSGTKASVPTKAFHDKMAAKDFKTKTMNVLSSIQSRNNVFMEEQENHFKSHKHRPFVMPRTFKKSSEQSRLSYVPVIFFCPVVFRNT